MIGVAIGTYGDEQWRQRGEDRFIQETESRAKGPVVHWHHHEPVGLHVARNEAARRLASQGLSHVVFLDADDRLDPGYIDAMATALAVHGDGPILAQPATLGVYPDGSTDDEAVLIEPSGSRLLLQRNIFVIGTMIRLDQFLAVGGFRDLPATEDWDLFLRLRATGARWVQVPGAVYRVGVNPNSRNTGSTESAKVYRQIVREHRVWCTERGIDLVGVHQLEADPMKVCANTWPDFKPLAGEPPHPTACSCVGRGYYGGKVS